MLFPTPRLYTAPGFLHQAQENSRTDQHSAIDLIENISNMRGTRLFFRHYRLAHGYRINSSMASELIPRIG